MIETRTMMKKIQSLHVGFVKLSTIMRIEYHEYTITIQGIHGNRSV